MQFKNIVNTIVEYESPTAIFKRIVVKEESGKFMQYLIKEDMNGNILECTFQKEVFPKQKIVYEFKTT